MPNEQNPQRAGVEAVVSNIGYSFRESFTAGAGGQTVFTLTKEIAGQVTVFEDGVITTRAVNITGTKQVTTGAMPEGTTVNIIY